MTPASAGRLLGFQGGFLRFFTYKLHFAGFIECSLCCLSFFLIGVIVVLLGVHREFYIKLSYELLWVCILLYWYLWLCYS